MAEGWICPKCGRALSPWTLECPCYKIKSYVNYTTTNTDYSYIRDTMVNPEKLFDKGEKNGE